METTRVILIGGSSNIGKTTLARHLAERLGWTHLSTDALARHPGRPWRQGERPVPPHVAEHYLGLSVDELMDSVLTHYRNMWSGIEAIVRDHAEDEEEHCLVLEGSALWPETVATLKHESVCAVWLTAEESLFTARIRANSAYEEANDAERALIDKFLARTIAYDRAMRARVRALDLPVVEIGAETTQDEAVDLCLEAMRPLG